MKVFKPPVGNAKKFGQYSDCYKKVRGEFGFQAVGQGFMGHNGVDKVRYIFKTWA